MKATQRMLASGLILIGTATAVAQEPVEAGAPVVNRDADEEAAGDAPEASPHSVSLRPQLMPAAEVNRSETNLRFFSDAGYGLTFGGDVDELRVYRIGAAVLTEAGNEVEIHFGGTDLKLASGSELDLLISNPREFKLGLGWRGFVAPDNYWLNPYYTLALELGAVSYRYRVPTPGGTREWDYIAGVGGHAGLGFLYNRGGGLNAFAEATIGGTVLVDETHEQYRNDFFDNYGHVTFRAGLSYSF